MIEVSIEKMKGNFLASKIETMKRELIVKLMELMKVTSRGLITGNN